VILYLIGKLLSSEFFAGKVPPPPAASQSRRKKFQGHFNLHRKVNQKRRSRIQAWGGDSEAFKKFPGLIFDKNAYSVTILFLIQLFIGYYL